MDFRCSDRTDRLVSEGNEPFGLSIGAHIKNCSDGFGIGPRIIAVIGETKEAPVVSVWASFPSVDSSIDALSARTLGLGVAL